jgi:hypothetical protein
MISYADLDVRFRYIGSDKAIADLPIFNGNVSDIISLAIPLH